MSAIKGGVKQPSTPDQSQTEVLSSGMELGDVSDQPLSLWRPPTPDREESESQATHQRPWFRSLFSGDSNSHRRIDTSPKHSFDEEFGRSDTIEDVLVDNSLLLHDEHVPVSSGIETLTSTERKKLSRIRRGRNRVAKENSSNLFNDNSLQEDPHGVESNKDYIMMKSQHGTKKKGNKNISFSIPSTGKRLDDQTQNHCDYFFMGIEDKRSQRNQKSSRRISSHDCELPRSDKESRSTDEYFLNRSRQSFLEAHNALNSHIPPNQHSESDTEEDELDLTLIFTLGCSPQVRDNERKVRINRGDVLPAIADIRKSSLSYIHNGRIKIKVPKDNVRLVMDPIMESGILSVERNVMPLLSSNTEQHDKIECGAFHTKNDEAEAEIIEERFDQHRKAKTSKPVKELSYTLTVDEDLYKRIFSEINQSRLPCGFYYCCHDSEDKSQHVHIGVAICGLVAFFIALGALTSIWPYD